MTTHMPTIAQHRPPRIYAFMPDHVLDQAIAELERITSQPAFDYSPPTERAGILDALAAAMAEADKRQEVNRGD